MMTRGQGDSEALPPGRLFSDQELISRYDLVTGTFPYGDNQLEMKTILDLRRILILDIEGALKLSLRFKGEIHGVIQKKVAKAGKHGSR